MVAYTRLDTTYESQTADGCHAVGNGNGGQAATTSKSIITNGCHAVGNVD